MSTPLIEGSEYVYVSAHPPDCTGHRYLLYALATFVPVYQSFCVVTALSGPDKGKTFGCTFENFSRRYELVRAAEQANNKPVPAKVAGRPEGPGD